MVVAGTPRVEPVQAERYRVRDFIVDVEAALLLRDGQHRTLPPRTFELLLALVRAHPRLVRRHELLESVWPDEFVTDQTLSHRVMLLRRALGDDAAQPAYIVGERGWGYRLLGPVERLGRVGSGDAARSPYPGLSAFGEEDAGRFFGREPEVRALWARLPQRRLLAVIGPSGSGKTSFVRAGVVARRPAGWGAVICTPGSSPLASLAQALAPEVVGDAEAVRGLPCFDDAATAVATFRRWREAEGDALLVVDQLEELFTLNAPAVHSAVATLLGRLAGEAGLHVLLSLRDDFLMQCHEHEALRPVFEAVTPLGRLSAEDLRRALVEPARAEGFAFEDEALVDEMLQSVEGERGALPLLAFAVARLWDRRDPDSRRLTRAAHHAIGGVAGALSQHAEVTLARIGPDREPVVREVFRSLVTSQGTRAAREREELLSAFPDRGTAERVLEELVDARLVTSYEVAGEEGAGNRHRVEIAHESLLRAWPRLVRWQTQDADGAQLRDQLRQAAHLWEEKGRSEDLLWTGTSEREFELWRERYPGTLSATEGAFARAMVARACRKRRLRRLAFGAVVAASLAVAAVVAVSRQQAVSSAERARAEARRAEASTLVALGRAELDRYPTAALAYARRSLEVADTPEGRRFAVEALWRSPTLRILPVDPPGWGAAFSPDDRRLAAFTFSENVYLWENDGRLVRTIGGHRLPGDRPGIAFTPSGDALLAWTPGERRVRMLSVPDGREIRWLGPEPPPSERATPWRGGEGWGVRPEGLLVFRGSSADLGGELWPYDGGPPRAIGSWPAAQGRALDATASRLILLRDRRLLLRPVAGPVTTPEREVARLLDDPPGAQEGRGGAVFRLSPRGDKLAVGDRTGRLALWSLDRAGSPPPRVLRMPLPDPEFSPAFDPSGSRLVWGSSAERTAALWDLDDPPDAEPQILRRPDVGMTKGSFFDHRGRWAVVVNHHSLGFWAVGQPHVRVMRGHTAEVTRVAFTPDARWLVSCGFDGVRAWPLRADAGTARLVFDGQWCLGMALSPDGREVLIGGPAGAHLAPLSGASGRWLFRTPDENVQGLAIDASGRRAATGPGYTHQASKLLRLVDLASGSVRELPLPPPGASGAGYDGGVWQLAFTPQGQLLQSGRGGIRRFDPETGASEWVWRIAPQWVAVMAASADGRVLLASAATRDVGNSKGRPFLLFDLARGTRREVHSHGTQVAVVALDPTGRTLVTGDTQGAVRVGPVDGEPHLLLGHRGAVSALAVSPDGHWIASASGDEVRLWPMPQTSRAPLHMLPHGELMAKLAAFTNLEVAPDAGSPTGYALRVGPFPGWRDAPLW